MNAYYPKLFKEALALLNENNLTIIAGGTDLMVKNQNSRGLNPKFKEDVLFIKNIEELNYIRCENNMICIGANVTLSEVMDNFTDDDLLRKVIKQMASPGIRNSATLIGNVVNASPAGDSLPLLYLLDSVMVIASFDNERYVNIEDFINSPGETILQKNEMIKEIRINDYNFTKNFYKKVGARKADTISKVSFVAAANIKNNLIKEFKIAFGAVGPVVVRKRSIENEIVNNSVDWLKENYETILSKYDSYIIPIDDQRSTSNYRKQVALNLLREFIKHIDVEVL